MGIHSDDPSSDPFIDTSKTFGPTASFVAFDAFGDLLFVYSNKK